jgi:hypothetical protein
VIQILNRAYKTSSKNTQTLFTTTFQKLDDQLRGIGANEVGATALVGFIREETLRIPTL